jgi:hypothetical protein
MNGGVKRLDAHVDRIVTEAAEIRCAARQGKPPRRWVPRPRPEACHLFGESNALTDRAGGSIAVLRRAAGSRQTPAGEDPSDDRTAASAQGALQKKCVTSVIIGRP